MRRRARVDANQEAVVKAIRSYGMSVKVISSMGKGVPDLAVGYQGLTCLLEVKDGDKSASRTKLTPDEQRFADSWRGHRAVVYTAEEAIQEVLEHARGAGRL